MSFSATRPSARVRATGWTFPEVLASRGLLPGIKVDTGVKPLAGTSGERITEGLDGLRERLAGYAYLGARFAKWRAVFAVGDGSPSWPALRANAHALARYACCATRPAWSRSSSPRC